MRGNKKVIKHSERWGGQRLGHCDLFLPNQPINQLTNQLTVQNVEIRKRAKSPSDFFLGGYIVAMDRGFRFP